MNREDLSNMAFYAVVTPLALVLFALTIVAIVLVPRGRRAGFIVCAAVFGAVGLTGVFIAAWMWGITFDYGDAGKSVPPAIDTSMAFGLSVACASYAGFLATGASATVRRRRLRAAHEPT